MTKQLLTKATGVLLITAGLLAVSCAKNYVMNDTAIDTAVKMVTSEVTASGAIISLASTKDVAGFIVAGPVKKSYYPTYSTDESIKTLEWVKKNGKKYDAVSGSVLIWEEDNLDAGTDFIVGCVAYKADGTICSAPWFTAFKTGAPEVTTTVALVSNVSPYSFSYTIKMNEYAAKYKWIKSTDKAVTSLEDAALKQYVEANGQFETTDILNGYEASTEKVDFIVAAIPYDDLDRPGTMSKSFASTSTVVKVKVGTQETQLAAKTEGIDYFTGTVDVPATGNFTISINGTDYGFTAYSGNGGVGTVNNMFAAVPYYNLKSEMTWQFKVEKAMGQMTPVAEGGNEFWTNLASAGKLDVIVDMTVDATPRYFFYLQNTDANRVFYEGFDMAVWGGNYHSYTKGTGYNGANYAPAEGSNDVDGTEPGVSSTVSQTGTGIDFITWPVSEECGENEVHPGDILMKNLDLQDWGLKRTFLISGTIRLGNSKSSHYDAWVITPKFTSLTAATNVTVTTEMFSFAGGGEIEITVLGDGTFTGATITNTAGFNESCNVGSTYLPSDKICMIDGTICPQQTNSVVNKTTCKVVLSVAGATSNTQIKIYVPERTTGKLGRTSIDYISVTK